MTTYVFLFIPYFLLYKNTRVFPSISPPLPILSFIPLPPPFILTLLLFPLLKDYKISKFSDKLKISNEFKLLPSRHIVGKC